MTANLSKVSNVLVNQSGAVKLLDFSIAKLMEDSAVSRLTRDSGAALTPTPSKNYRGHR